MQQVSSSLIHVALLVFSLLASCASNTNKPSADTSSDPVSADAAVLSPADASSNGNARDADVPEAGAIDAAARDAEPDFTFSPTPSPFALGTSGEASSEYAAYMPLVASIGCRSIRVFGGWHGIEPVNNQFDFSVDDARTQLAASLGMEIDGILAYSTPWALPDGTDDLKIFPLTHLDDWADYVSQVVDRYRRTVRYWEVWNEPNSPGFNGGNHTADDYAKLVRTSYAAAKAINPGAKLGLTVANYDVAYLQRVIEALAQQGAAGSFDFIAVHPYELVLRMLENFGEVQYLQVVGNLRKMLARAAPSKVDVPIRFTELSGPIGSISEGVTIDPNIAASLLIKSYVLGLAQGVEQVSWFEIKDAQGSQNFGLLDDDLSKRVAYTAYASMTSVLGDAPRYLGWVTLTTNNTGLGFVFESAATTKLAAWMPQGFSGQLSFDMPVEIVDIYTNTSQPLAANTNYTLTSKPIFVQSVPAPLRQQALANVSKPLPWPAPSESAQLASIVMGAPNAERGLEQDRPTSTSPFKFADGTGGARLEAGKNNEVYWAVNPSFADYETGDFYVRVDVRAVETLDATQSPMINLFYQSIAGDPKDPVPYPYQAVDGGWTSVAGDQKWHSVTWHVTNGMIVHTFGYGLYVQLQGSHPLVFGKVQLSKTPF